ncbi:MAG: adenosyl-hopene transferase HpnH, partial [Rhodospirillaceae bacterium]|nr:adenosyl-hopene transferase HpnH [Rhodospirillaceae bacterium]
ALLLERKLKAYYPSEYLTLSIHLDGVEEHHDEMVSRKGVYKKAVSAIKAAKAAGFKVMTNTTIFNNADANQMREFFDELKEIGTDGMMISPGYSYDKAPRQELFLQREETVELFQKILDGHKGKGWDFNHSPFFLEFLQGKQDHYDCTPWGNPTRNVFGWQKPCYLIGEGYVGSFRELMDETNWDSYGTGNYEKCADCMVHCGYEPTAVSDTVAHPLKALKVALGGIETSRPMVADTPLDNQRPAEYVFEELVRETEAGTSDKSEVA